MFLAPAPAAGVAAAATPQQAGSKRQRPSDGSKAPMNFNTTSGTDPQQILTQEVVQALLEMNLINAANIRQIEGAIYYTWLLPGAQPLVVQSRGVGRAYAQAVKTRTQKGAPHQHIAHYIVNHVKDLPGLDAGHKQCLEDFLKNHDTLDAIGMAIPVARVSETYQKMGKIVLSFSHDAEAKSIPSILNAAFTTYCGATLKTGQAPKGPRERILQAALDQANGGL
jgi:hypothetical protein